jgi:hypothetical protein
VKEKMKKDLFVMDRIDVPVNAGTALNFICEIKNIDQYEPKVDQAKVNPETDKKGSYEVKGRFAGIPWSGKFSYEINEEGFYSEILNSPIPGLKVQGGFKVKKVSDKDCRISHFENYQLPGWLFAVRPLLKAYLTQSIKKELEDVKKLILEADNKQKSSY